MAINYAIFGLIIIIIIIIIGYFIYTNNTPPPSSTACSPSNIKGICEAAGQVCSTTGTCVDGTIYPCSASDLYGYCPPNSNTICDNITGSPTLGTCIPNKPCGLPPGGSITGYCPPNSNTSCNPHGICVSNIPCGTGTGEATNGTCSDSRYICNSGVCGPPLPCGPGNETPVAQTSQSGTCKSGQNCRNGVCLTICGTGNCTQEQQCVGSKCVDLAPNTSCDSDYGGTGSSPCLINYPKCNGYKPGVLGICATQPSTCVIDTDCSNSAYPNGVCSNGACTYPPNCTNGFVTSGGNPNYCYQYDPTNPSALCCNPNKCLGVTCDIRSNECCNNGACVRVNWNGNNCQN